MVSENREAAAGLRNSRAITTPSGMAHHGSVTSGTGTLVLNKKSTPCIRALKSERTKAIYEEGLMAPDALKGIRDVYFHGNMEAAPALGGQSAGLIGEVKPARDHRGDRGAVLRHHQQARRTGDGTVVRLSSRDFLRPRITTGIAARLRTRI